MNFVTNLIINIRIQVQIILEGYYLSCKKQIKCLGCYDQQWHWNDWDWM